MQLNELFHGKTATLSKPVKARGEPSKKGSETKSEFKTFPKGTKVTIVSDDGKILSFTANGKTYHANTNTFMNALNKPSK
jgi:hypothetical protein